MIWTTKKPTQPGWYWYRRPSVHGGFHKDVCRVRQIDVDNAKVAFMNEDTEWSSEPIPEPQECR